jgi:hypothetical protein
MSNFNTIPNANLNANLNVKLSDRQIGAITFGLGLCLLVGMCAISFYAGENKANVNVDKIKQNTYNEAYTNGFVNGYIIGMKKVDPEFYVKKPNTNNPNTNNSNTNNSNTNNSNTNNDDKSPLLYYYNLIKDY